MNFPGNMKPLIEGAINIFTALFGWFSLKGLIRDSGKKKDLEADVEELKKDAKIDACPDLHGNDLIDSLRTDK